MRWDRRFEAGLRRSSVAEGSSGLAVGEGISSCDGGLDWEPDERGFDFTSSAKCRRCLWERNWHCRQVDRRIDDFVVSCRTDLWSPIVVSESGSERAACLSKGCIAS